MEAGLICHEALLETGLIELQGDTTNVDGMKRYSKKMAVDALGLKYWKVLQAGVRIRVEARDSIDEDRPWDITADFPPARWNSDIL